MTEELRACPNCGGESKLVTMPSYYGGEIHREYSVECTRCGASIRRYASQEAALRHWNEDELEPTPKPCPFCGGKADVWESRGTYNIIVGCDECRMFVVESDEERAIEAWNRRINL